MGVDDRRPNVNALRLGLYLRVAREFLELSYEEAAARAGCDSDWLVRVETGYEWPSPVQVERMMKRYGIRAANMADIMIDLASRPDGPPWLAEHVGRMESERRDVVIMEAEASVIHTYGAAGVPQLAWAEELGRKALPWVFLDCDVDVEWALVAERQRYRAGGRRRVLDVIVDEGALMSLRGDPKVAEAQIRHLLELDADPDVTIRIAPWEAPMFEERACSFDVLEFPGVSDRIGLAHSALGTHFAHGDLWPIWKLIEEKAAATPAESREILQRFLTDVTTGRRDPRL